ncbi:MAG: DNA-processing protein DprA [Bacteroidales bacterium]|nr:DNA-processing protein DprA [Bacteroidales bacterium]
MQNDLVYWVLLAHLPKWTTLNTNKLIVEILHNQQISFADFFHKSHKQWQSVFNLAAKDIESLENAKKELPNCAFLVESLLNQGYELTPINSDEYPAVLKSNLKLKFSPPLIYTKGNKDLLKTKTIAIVGSRKAIATSLKFTKNIAIKASQDNKCVISGGAKGVDRIALEETLENHGYSILVLPQGILTYASGMRKYYKEIVGGNLLLLSTFFPKAGWSTGLAMARNKYIYGLSKDIYIAESASEGGTWSGAMEGIKAQRNVYIRKPQDNETNANNLLIQSGAKPVDINGNLLKYELPIKNQAETKIEQVKLF